MLILQISYFIIFLIYLVYCRFKKLLLIKFKCIFFWWFTWNFLLKYLKFLLQLRRRFLYYTNFFFKWFYCIFQTLIFILKFLNFLFKLSNYLILNLYLFFIKFLLSLNLANLVFNNDWWFKFFRFDLFKFCF